MPRIIDVVEAPNQGPNEMVVRVPEVGSGDFRLGSQVIVRESQNAIFYRDGKSLDMFGPGRHTITTANLPLISNVMSFFTGGNDVFTAEVYFVNMREFTDLKWGTPQPISLRDSELGYAARARLWPVHDSDRRAQDASSTRSWAPRVSTRPARSRITCATRSSAASPTCWAKT